MFSMSSQDTRRKVRLNEKVESRVRGDLYARFGGECLETYRDKTRQGAGCLAYGSLIQLRKDHLLIDLLQNQGNHQDQVRLHLLECL